MSSPVIASAFAKYFDLEHRFGAFNYHPLPVVLERGEGVYVWDVEGRRYLDFLAAYSAVNQGHCHPRIIRRLVDQAQKLTLTSRAFHHNLLGLYEKYLCELLGYERLLPMNTGVEACETAVKLARHWGYRVKGVPENKAAVVFAEGNFWGRSIAAISASSDPLSYTDFGPYVPEFYKIPYDDPEALENILRENPHIVAFMCEPIQGEAGVILPETGYLKAVREICSRYKVLWIADEVQTGLGRTGKLLACDHEDVKPDILCLGKALSGGVMPVSAVLSSSEVMLTLKPGEHGSTFGGNPLACAVAMEAVQVVVDENLSANAEARGRELREALVRIDSSRISAVRGKGLMNALVIRPKGGITAWEVCLKMMELGLLAKPTHHHTIRLTPPLCITRAQVEEAAHIIRTALLSLDAV
ncbi:MAG: ornithine--oxo-acid transaminase [Flavobacteriales bacterium]|nr:ornithine--oxo-acid transaminase [Flavobacteriales bacterium]MDW8432034.1 ornithine--oxo-acid transaminase [Flavobacteriales bacterium]